MWFMAAVIIGGRGSTQRTRAIVVASALIGFLSIAWPTNASASSASELVRLARAHEKSREEDLALRRYTEALSLDAMCEDAYMGLGSLRARRGDLREAERVYSVALERMPRLRLARLGRAYVRRALGANTEAAQDLLADTDEDPARLRILAGWYAEDGQTPAQLSIWRKIAAHAEMTHDAALLHEARTMVRALVILVGTADPAASPPNDRDRGLRHTIAVLARRGL